MTRRARMESVTPSVKCPRCGRSIGVYANGKIRPHYGATGAGTCSGAYTIPEVPSSPTT